MQDPQERETESAVYGLIAEFDDPEHVVEATRSAYATGYRAMDAYAPFPVHGLAQALGFRRTWLPLLTLAGALAGAAAGFGLQHFTAVINYPINVGGRPDLSWPSFIPITFELAILFAAFGSVGGMIALNGLPRPHHPVFNVERFGLASRDRFFLCIEASDPMFDAERTRSFLEDLGPQRVEVVTDDSVDGYGGGAPG
jgi:hypothetical protein